MDRTPSRQVTRYCYLSVYGYARHSTGRNLLAERDRVRSDVAEIQIELCWTTASNFLLYCVSLCYGPPIHTDENL
jgi:hypothetical protein